MAYVTSSVNIFFSRLTITAKQIIAICLLFTTIAPLQAQMLGQKLFVDYISIDGNHVGCGLRFLGLNSKLEGIEGNISLGRKINGEKYGLFQLSGFIASESFKKDNGSLKKYVNVHYGWVRSPAGLKNNITSKVNRCKAGGKVCSKTYFENISPKNADDLMDAIISGPFKAGYNKNAGWTDIVFDFNLTEKKEVIKKYKKCLKEFNSKP